MGMPDAGWEYRMGRPRSGYTWQNQTTAGDLYTYWMITSTGEKPQKYNLLWTGIFQGDVGAPIGLVIPSDILPMISLPRVSRTGR